MPPEQGRRGDDEGDPAVARDDPTCGGEEDPVDGPEPGRARRAAEHPELMAEDEDLEVPGSVVSAMLATGDEETGESADDETEEEQHPPIVPGLRTGIGVSDPHGPAMARSLASVPSRAPRAQREQGPLASREDVRRLPPADGL